MLDLRHRGIASAFILALFVGAGYLAGSSARKEQTPDRAVTAGHVNGVTAEAVTLRPTAIVALPPDDQVGFPPSCVLVHGGSDYVVDYGGVLVLPLDFAAGGYTTASISEALLTAIAPGPSTAEFLLASREDFY